MATFTLDDLKVIMRESSGVTEGAEGAELTEDTLDAPLRDLGYDSLAVLEIASRLQRDYRLSIPDEGIEQMKTARTVIDYVNDQLPAAAV